MLYSNVAFLSASFGVAFISPKALKLFFKPSSSSSFGGMALRGFSTFSSFNVSVIGSPSLQFCVSRLVSAFSLSDIAPIKLAGRPSRGGSLIVIFSG
jgi:hypothetical protein